MIPFRIVLSADSDVRNEQAGDWKFYNDGRGSELLISSVPLKDERHQFLIQFHEMIEAVLCGHRGITDEAVTGFDAMFEGERTLGLHSETDENGGDPRAPYRKEHFTATTIERLMAAELGVDWQEYEQAISDYFK